MEDNLLFANNRKEFIEEFLAAMEGMECNFHIDTASSGLEAAKLLKKKRYKVVVTGMNLSTFGGAKLIAYLNKHSPQTTCIVYTRRMEPAYLKLLVNELKVFRIFQKPADYEMIYAAVQEGFALYEKEAEDFQRRQEMDQAVRRASLKAATLEQVSKERPREKEDFLRFMRGLLEAFQADINAGLAEPEKKRLFHFEEEVLRWLVQEEGREPRGIPQMAESLSEDFCHPERGQEIEIQAEGDAGQAASEDKMRLHLVLWLVLKHFSTVSSTYRIKAYVRCQEDGHFQIEAEGSFPQGVWERGNREGAGGVIANVAHRVLGNVAQRFSQTFQEGTVTYRMEV